MSYTYGAAQDGTVYATTIGVGTSTPLARTHIYNTVAAKTATLIQQTATGGVGLQVKCPASQTANTAEFYAAGSSTASVVVDATGNLTLTGDISSPALVGQVAHFAKNTAPTGWLKCNGSIISRTTYATLYATIGTTFGVGDGSTTFTLPDLRGEFLRGWDDARGVDSGRTFGTSQTDAFKTHTHSISTGYAETSTTYYTVGNPRSTAVANTVTAATGGTETRPRNIAMLACIKY